MSTPRKPTKRRAAAASPRRTAVSKERRQAERVEVLGQLHGCVIAANVPLVIRETSATGFSVEAPVPFPAGAEHAFRFSAADGREALVNVRSIHCLRVNLPDADPFYVSGFAFESESPSTRDLIAAILDSLAVPVARV
jgi:hypothetical protein